MRIRRRGHDVVQPSQAPSSSPGLPFSPAPPTTSPRGSSPSSSGTAAPAGMEPPPEHEVDRSMREASPLRPHLPSRRQDRQEEEKEEGDDATEKKRGGDGGAEHGHGEPAHISSRYPTEVDEKEAEQRKEDEQKATVAICKKGDGKGWRCKREAQLGYSLCQYHLAKLRSHGSRIQKEKPKAAAAPPSSERPAVTGNHLQTAPRQRKRRKKEQAPSTAPGLAGAFYYYSGFGPRRGKRRGDRSEDRSVEAPDGEASQVRHGDDLDHAAVGGEEDEDDNYGCGGATGDRKPWKSRSLSSLL